MIRMGFPAAHFWCSAELIKLTVCWSAEMPQRVTDETANRCATGECESAKRVEIVLIDL